MGVPEPLQVGAKAALFLGTVLLVGAGVFPRWIMRPPLPGPTSMWLRRGALLGVLLVGCGSGLEAADAISRAAGAFDASLVLPYLLETRHGNAVIARLILAALLIAAGGPYAPAWLRGRPAFSVLAAGLLLTLSLVSHAGAQGRPLPLLADLAHVTGVAFWAGSVIYAAWLLAWPRAGPAPEPIQATMRRVSSVGLVGLSVIVVTGVYAAIVRLPDVGALTRTPYGRALLIKAAAVAAVIAAAAVNRFVAIPWMNRGLSTVALRRSVRAETLFVLVVLGLTGVLVSEALPEPPTTVAGSLTFNNTVGAWMLRGTVTGRGAEGFSLELHVQDARGAPAPAAMAVDLQATMLDMVMEPLNARLPRVGPGLYRGTFQLPMAGQWQLTIRTSAGAVNVGIPTEAARAPASQVRWTIAAPGLLAAVLGVSFAVTGLRRLGAGTCSVGWALVAAIMLLIGGGTAVIRGVR